MLCYFPHMEATEAFQRYLDGKMSDVKMTLTVLVTKWP